MLIRRLVKEDLSESNTILYHGSNKQFTHFKTPTGKSDLDVMNGGVVYLTSDIETAKKYGKYVYAVQVDNSNLHNYSELRDKLNLPKKKSKYLRNVFVAKPDDCTIIEIV